MKSKKVYQNQNNSLSVYKENSSTMNKRELSLITDYNNNHSYLEQQEKEKWMQYQTNKFSIVLVSTYLLIYINKYSFQIPELLYPSVN